MNTTVILFALAGFALLLLVAAAWLLKQIAQARAEFGRLAEIEQKKHGERLAMYQYVALSKDGLQAELRALRMEERALMLKASVYKGLAEVSEKQVTGLLALVDRLGRVQARIQQLLKQGVQE